MSKRFTITIEEDEFGELILPIPDDVCEDLGWTIGDELEFEVDDVTGSFTLTKVEEQFGARPQRKPHSTAFTLSMTEEEIIKCVSANEDAHHIINDCILKLADRVVDLEKTVSALIEAHNKLLTVDKVQYKPPGSEDYLTIKENLDLIYKRLEETK